MTLRTEWTVVAGGLCLALLGGCARVETEPDPRSDTSRVGTVEGRAEPFHSVCLGGEITVLPGVFRPDEAELLVVPLLMSHPALFAGREVLEIGTGSGLVGLCAARLGSRRVVLTDISPEAVDCARRNAEALGLEGVVEARLVPESDPSAYSVIRPDESFDILLSNPPYSLDLDAPRDTTVVETGDLGFSILRGLRAHLRPDGFAVLLYNSVFYHKVMVRYARQLGFEVRSQSPNVLSPWETEALFNSYLERVLSTQGMDARAMRFDWTQDELALFTRSEPQPLLSEFPTGSFPGIIVVRGQAGPER